MPVKLPKGLGGQIVGPGNYTPMAPAADSAPKIDFNKLKTKFESLKDKIVKKFSFVKSLSLLPANSYSLFEEDEQIPPEIVKSKPIYFMMIVPEEQYKNNATKIKPELIKMAKESNWALIGLGTAVSASNSGGRA